MSKRKLSNTGILHKKRVREERGTKLSILTYNNIPFNSSYNPKTREKVINFTYAIKDSNNFKLELNNIISSNIISSNIIYYLTYEPNSSKILNIKYKIKNINNYSEDIDAQDVIFSSRYNEEQSVSSYFNVIDTNDNIYNTNNIDYEDNLYTDGKNYFYISNPKKIISFLNNLFKENNYFFQINDKEVLGGNNKKYKVYIEDIELNKYYIKYNSKKYYLTINNISKKNNKYYINIDNSYYPIYI